MTAKKWYLGIVENNVEVEINEELKEKITHFKNKITDEKFEWTALNHTSIDDTLLKATYYMHTEVEYRTWVYNSTNDTMEPKLRKYTASLGLSFILKKGYNLIIFTPHPLNDINFKTKEIKHYVAKISSLLFGELTAIKLLKYNISLLNDHYKDYLKGMGFSSRLGGVKSGIIFGEDMEGDMIYEEAKKGEERYSIFKFPLLNGEIKVGVSVTGAIVTFNKIDNYEHEFFKQLYDYISIAKNFY